jgi:hypothetical protein
VFEDYSLCTIEVFTAIIEGIELSNKEYFDFIRCMAILGNIIVLFM